MIYSVCCNEAIHLSFTWCPAHGASNYPRGMPPPKEPDKDEVARKKKANEIRQAIEALVKSLVDDF